MRVPKLISYGWILASIVVMAAGPALAGERKRKPAKAPDKLAMKREALKEGAPALPSGGTIPGSSAAVEGPDTIKIHRNALGQTVYEIVASHVDLSPPLSEMAASAKAKAEGEGEGEEYEGSRNSQLPLFRRVLANVPDPVAKPAVQVQSFSVGPTPLAPTTGFNFAGVPSSGLSPSDANGSVGNNQYVETVNSRYQVWSLQRSPAKVATSVLGPININTLWTGFTGPCETQNSGDPIVLYDKMAGRWMISQFTTGAVSGTYYQCVAVSQGASATGAFHRYAFAVPGGIFGDYPHFGVWTDAYYVMAHGFTNTSGGYIAALFAAMDRTKMIAGNPTATWQVIQDPLEGGHMPADHDGFALPPTGAPGIFLSLHSDGMYVYRMSVDFATPANTQRTLQAVVPVAPSTGACGGGGSCIPQPGTGVTVGSLADRLMFRAAYRNFVDHESIVVSHSVDPSVTGVVSGVRWYDIRLSGSPDATCPTYPCLYQQGTIADVANGRSRWMPSIAMDAAENIVVGYSTTGKTAGIENHSIRYTGRAKSDPPGTMTVPEATVIVGTANNSNSRWGDYTSMSADPFDDCTLWYVNQFFTATGSWSTRIASTQWPVGSGAGQCQTSFCVIRPTSAPAIGSASAPADNQMTVTWSPVSPTPGSYAIERADGACGSEGYYRPLAFVSSATTTYNDTTVLGGITYSYRVIAAQDAIGRCQAKVSSACTSATATGLCNLAPSFGGASSAASTGGSNCGVTVDWAPATTACPLTPNLRYNIYRGTTPAFVPAPANRIATCVLGPSYVDTDNLTSGTTYYYAVRAEDDSTGNGGPCNDGNEDTNTVVVAATPYGSGTQPSPGTFLDGGGDGNALLLLNASSPGNTSDRPWRIVTTANDPGANHTPGGAYAYRNAGPSASAGHFPNSCTEIQAPALTIGAATVGLKYWERHQIEYHWDGLAVEYAVNGGPWTTVPAPSNNPADGCDPGDATGGWEDFSCTGLPPVNACGYATTDRAFNGPLLGGTGCSNFSTGPATAYAHRCHAVSGLTPGDSIQFRWRFSSDPGAEFAGFYLDDVAVTQVRLPNACVPDTCSGQPDGTTCSDGSACTTGDSCGGGTCQPGVTAPGPGEVANLAVAGASGTTLSWTTLGGGIVYDVATSTLTDLRANGAATAVCMANDVAGTSTGDARPDPASGEGYYYIVRGQTACASGTYGSDSTAVPRVPGSACP